MKCEFLKVTLNYFLDWRRPPDIPPVHEGISCKNRSQDPRKQCQSQGLGAKTCRRRGRKNNYDFRVLLSLFYGTPLKVSIHYSNSKAYIYQSRKDATLRFLLVSNDLAWFALGVLRRDAWIFSPQHQSIQNTQGALTRVVQGLKERVLSLILMFQTTYSEHPVLSSSQKSNSSRSCWTWDANFPVINVLDIAIIRRSIDDLHREWL